MHDKAGVRYGEELVKKVKFLIQGAEVAEVFISADTYCGLPVDAELKLFPEALQGKRPDGIGKLGVIIIIQVLILLNKTDGTNGGNVKLLEKGLGAAIGLNHGIYKFGRQFGGIAKGMGYTTVFCQLLWRGKIDAGDTCAKPAGVNTNQHSSWLVVAVIFLKERSDSMLHGWLPMGIQGLYPWWQMLRRPQIPEKSDGFFGEHSFAGVSRLTRV